MTITGGCLCGQLRYAIDASPKIAGKCYCTDCRKETGSGHMTFVSFPADAVVLTGERRVFTKAGDSGDPVDRVFCPECGTTVVGYPKSLRGLGAIRAGTLDEPPAIAPSFAVYCDRATA